MKSLEDIWEEFKNERRTLNQGCLLDLKWHIEHDEDPFDAIVMARNIIMDEESSLLKGLFVPSIAKQLDHPLYQVRLYALFFLISQIGLKEYGEKALQMACYDPRQEVREEAISNFGYIINEVDNTLVEKMAKKIYEVLTNDDFKKYSKRCREYASDSVLHAMDLGYLNFSRAWNSDKFDPIWKEFLKKYKLEYKPVFRR